MPKKSSIALFIAATSVLTISTSVKSGEGDIGGLKEWNTDMQIDADFILDKEAQKLADEADELGYFEFDLQGGELLLQPKKLFEVLEAISSTG